MTPQLEGTLETLQMDLAGRQLRLVLAAEAPPRSKTEMEALGWDAADQLSVIPGRLGLHQEFGALLARQLLESDGSFG